MRSRNPVLGAILAVLLAGCASDDSPQVDASNKAAAASVGAMPPEKTREATSTLQEALGDRGGQLGHGKGR